MVSFKIVIGDKSGKCLQKEVKNEEANVFLGKVIGDTIPGDSFGYAGYEFKLTGGSDNCGFPMRWDVSGAARKRILTVGGVVGLKKTRDGMRKRKSVAGNTVHDKTAQINLKVLKAGAEPLFAPEVKVEETKTETKTEAKTEAKPVDGKVKETKTEAKAETKTEAKPVDAKVEEKKE